MKEIVSAPTHATVARGSAAGQLPRFRLGAEITAEQAAFLDEHGFLLFDRVASPDEVATLCAELDQVEAGWLAEGRRAVNGIPIF